jgi:hypothetical protein
MADALDHQMAVVMKEWDQCETGIARYDTIMFSIRTWAVTISTATVGAAATIKNPNIILISIVPALLFRLIDSVNKSYQSTFTTRVHEIQTYLSSEGFRHDLEAKGISFRSPVFAPRFELGKMGRLREVVGAARRMSVWITYVSILLINVFAYAGFLLTGVGR